VGCTHTVGRVPLPTYQLREQPNACCIPATTTHCLGLSPSWLVMNRNRSALAWGAARCNCLRSHLRDQQYPVSPQPFDDFCWLTIVILSLPACRSSSQRQSPWQQIWLCFEWIPYSSGSYDPSSSDFCFRELPVRDSFASAIPVEIHPAALR